MTDSLIFDLDGTIWDPTEAILAGWDIVLARYPQVHKKVTAADMAKTLGLPVPEIARRLFPDEPEELRQQMMKECTDAEITCLSKNGGRLYPGVEETLKKLSVKMPLFIVSNCEDGYIESFFKGNGLRRYFKDYECPGVTGLDKSSNIRLVVSRNRLSSPAYVGDTRLDSDSAREAGVSFIFARYGFGDADRYDGVIDSFAELTEMFVR